MPKITKMLNFEIKPEQYVRECDESELLELSIELENRLASRSKELLDIEVDYEVLVKGKYINP